MDAAPALVGRAPIAALLGTAPVAVCGAEPDEPALWLPIGMNSEPVELDVAGALGVDPRSEIPSAVAATATHTATAVAPEASASLTLRRGGGGAPAANGAASD